MLTWLSTQGQPARVVDPGAGSGRFLPRGRGPLPKGATDRRGDGSIGGAHVASQSPCTGWAGRAQVMVRTTEKETSAHCGTTAFVGNPPYVRHHGIAADWKALVCVEVRGVWHQSQRARRTSLALLFADSSAGKARRSGRLRHLGGVARRELWATLRRLLVEELGGVALHVLEPTVEAFPGTATTGAITCFRMGETDSPIRVRSVGGVGGSQTGYPEGRALRVMSCWQRPGGRASSAHRRRRRQVPSNWGAFPRTPWTSDGRQ